MVHRPPGALRGSIPWVSVGLLIAAAGLLVGPGTIPGLTQSRPMSGAAGPSGPGSTLAGTSEIHLVPSTRTFDVVGSPSAPSPAPVALGPALVYPGLYNFAPGGSGSVTITASGDPAPLRTTVNFSRIAPAHDGVVGYPEIQYGVKPWCSAVPCTEPPAASGLPLPLPVARLPPVQASVAFSSSMASGAAPTPFDIAFDLWLTQHPNQTSAGPGDVETMLWLYYSDPALLPGGAIGERTTPPSSGDPAGGLRWEVYVQHPDPSDGSGHWTVVYLVLSNPSPTALLQLDLVGLLATVEQVLSEGFPAQWSLHSQAGTEDPAALYLDDIELGSEFRPAAGASGGSARYTWDLSEYSLHLEGGSVSSALSLSRPSLLPLSIGSSMPWVLGYSGTTAARGTTIRGTGPGPLGSSEASGRRVPTGGTARTPRSFGRRP